MNRLIAIVLAVLATLSLVACTGAPAETTTPVETTTSATLPSFEETANPVAFFSLTLGEDYEDIRSMTVFDNEDGTVHVEYVGEVKKVGTMDANIFHGITAALAESGLAELNGQEVWSGGEANGSMYIVYADETFLTANFGGEIPQAYTDGYNKMDEFFRKLTASIPEYVPQPVVMGEVDETLLTELLAIINGSGMKDTDMFTIGSVAKDEYFAYTLGLSTDAGIASAASCAPMMMTTAYSLSIVTLEEGADAETICDDFAANVDWMKWVCVMPNNALVATKDNKVLCLVAEGQLYSLTAIGIEAAGWTVVETMENPT